MKLKENVIEFVNLLYIFLVYLHRLINRIPKYKIMLHNYGKYREFWSNVIFGSLSFPSNSISDKYCKSCVSAG